MSGMLPVTALTISSAVVCGTVLALLARLKLALARRNLFGSPAPTAPLPLWALNLALLPLMLLAGLLCDLWGVRAVVLFGSVALSLALSALSGVPTYARAITAVLVAAFGTACSATTSIVLMPRALFGSDETAASLHVGTVFFPLGALVASVLADILFRTIDQRRALLVLALLCLTPAFLVPLIDGRHFAFLTSTGEHAHLFLGLDLWLAGLVMFFYAPLEASISAWSAAYLTGEEDGRPAGAWVLPAFWVSFLSSRLLVGLLAHAGYLMDTNSGWLLVLPALLVAVVLGNLLGVNKGGALGVLAVGFLLGPIFSTLLAMVYLTAHAQQAPGLTFGALFAAGSAGSALFARLLAPRPHQHTAQVAMRWPLVLALLLGVAAVAYSLIA